MFLWYTSKYCIEPRCPNTFWNYLCFYAAVEQKGEWDECLPLAMFAYNKSVHASTGYTPHELVFGKRANTPINDNENELSYEELLYSLQDKLQFLHNEVHQNQIISKKISKERYDKHTRLTYFKADDLVAVTSHQTKSKFDKKFKGPYKVVTACDSDVKVIIGDNVRRYHCKDVKLYNTKL